MPKLAEALAERKALQERYNRLCARMRENAKVQEGDTPAEPPNVLLDEARRILEQVKDITIRINQTNISAGLPGGEGPSGTGNLMEAIAERDRLRFERQMLEQLSQAAQLDAAHRYGATRNEIKWRPTVDIAALQTQIDEVSKRYRMLDTSIQAANWQIDILTD